MSLSINSAVSSVVSTLSNAVEQGTSAAKSLGQEVEAGWDSVADGASAVFTEVGQAAQDTYAALGKGVSAVGQAVSEVGDALEDAGESVSDAIGNLGSGVADAYASVKKDVGSFLNTLA